MESLRELFKIGFGPSSSHTMGPQRAASKIKEQYPNASRFEVELYGSLALTGKGHLTDYIIKQTLGKQTIVRFKSDRLPYHPNGMKFYVYQDEKILDTITAYSIGGGTVEYVIDNNQLWLNTPEKNEAGTPNLFGAVAIMEAMKEIENIGFERIEKNEKELLQYLINGLKELNRVKLYADNDCIDDRLGILVFTIDGMKYYEVGEKLSEIKAIGVRQGGFCSHPYTRRVLGIPNNQLQEYINKNGIPGLVRVSLGIYNSKKEANIFLETVELLCRRYAR